MAKIKFGAFLTDMRGKIGGSVFSRNKGGAYAKNKVTPSNPKTSAQQVQRQLLSALSQKWRTLDQSAREAWRKMAKEFPMVDIFGDTYTLSGNMLYNRLNMNLSKVGQAQIDTPPSPRGVEDTELESASASATTLDLVLASAVPADMTGLLRVTPPFSQGIDNFNNRLRDFVTIDNTNGTAVSIFTDYEAKYGAPVSGQKIGIELLVVNNLTGEQGVPTKVSAIVA